MAGCQDSRAWALEIVASRCWVLHSDKGYMTSMVVSGNWDCD